MERGDTQDTEFECSIEKRRTQVCMLARCVDKWIHDINRYRIEWSSFYALTVSMSIAFFTSPPIASHCCYCSSSLLRSFRLTSLLLYTVCGLCHIITPSSSQNRNNNNNAARWCYWRLSGPMRRETIKRQFMSVRQLDAVQPWFSLFHSFFVVVRHWSPLISTSVSYHNNNDADFGHFHKQCEHEMEEEEEGKNIYKVFE